MSDSGRRTIKVNRAPVLTLWAAVVAERLGFDRGEALTLGRAVAGMSAAMKGKALGIFEPGDPREVEAERRRAAPDGELLHVRLLGRPVPALRTPDGIRAIDKDRPANPRQVERYLRAKFGDGYDAARAAMESLAASREPRDLAAHGFKLYEAFRPEVPVGVSASARASSSAAMASSTACA
jgi:hypothetical protein